MNNTLTLTNQWVNLFKNKVHLAVFILLLISTLISLKVFNAFLAFNEARTVGPVLNDYFLNMLVPTDVSIPLFTITWICIVGGLLVCLRTPCRAIQVFIGIIAMVAVRSSVMYLVPLEAPVGIIPLRDPVLEGSFYSGSVLQKDLFFSGHTANLALLTFMLDFKWLRYVFAIATVVVGVLLLRQHVHYTIDVLAAPFFAYLCAIIATKLALYTNRTIASNSQ